MTEASDALNKAHDAYSANPDSATLKHLSAELTSCVQGAIFKVFGKYLHPNTLAEDIVSDILKALPTFSRKSLFSTWAFGIARRKAVDALRHEKGGERGKSQSKSVKTFKVPSPEVLAELYARLNTADLSKGNIAFVRQVIGPNGLRRHALSDAERQRLRRLCEKLGLRDVTRNATN
jgi:DNA-directed RNA polymerase specialized sigma24 family protein